MTEEQWLASTDPPVMLSFLARGGLTDRKVRLLASACCRRVWPLLSDERSRRAVDLAEAYADGLVSRLRRSAAEGEARQATVVVNGGRAGYAAIAAKMTVAGRVVLDRVLRITPVEFATTPDETAAKGAAQAQLLRDVIGNPFRPVTLDRSALPPLVASLAEAAHENRELPSGHLERARLAVLSDALEEAGVTGEVLEHLRSPGPHVRGCWAVDLVLGRS